MGRSEDVLMGRRRGPLQLLETNQGAKRMADAPATLRTDALYEIIEGLIGACEIAYEDFVPEENVGSEAAVNLLLRLRQEAASHKKSGAKA